MEIEFRIAFLVSSKVELCLTLEMLRIFTRLKRAQGFQNFLLRQNSVLFFFKSVYIDWKGATLASLHGAAAA